MKQTIIFLILGFIFILGTTFAIAYALVQYNRIQNKEETLPEGKTLYKGIIRNNSLYELGDSSEKVDLELQDSNFQLTNLHNISDKNTSSTTSAIQGYYLVNPNNDLGEYNNKCVTVVASIKPGWEDVIKNNFVVNNQYTYQYSALILEDIWGEHSYEECLNDFSVKPNVENDKTYIGKIAFTTRPAPDIAYDFVLSLPNQINEPAEEGEDLNETIYLVPTIQEVELELYKAIGEEVEIIGTIEWGYAESKVIIVSDVKVK